MQREEATRPRKGPRAQPQRAQATPLGFQSSRAHRSTQMCRELSRAGLLTPRKQVQPMLSAWQKARTGCSSGLTPSSCALSRPRSLAVGSALHNNTHTVFNTSQWGAAWFSQPPLVALPPLHGSHRTRSSLAFAVGGRPDHIMLLHHPCDVQESRSVCRARGPAAHRRALQRCS